jgi:hypothetical protein
MSRGPQIGYTGLRHLGLGLGGIGIGLYLIIAGRLNHNLTKTDLAYSVIALIVGLFFLGMFVREAKKQGLYNATFDELSTPS